MLESANPVNSVVKFLALDYKAC